MQALEESIEAFKQRMQDYGTTAQEAAQAFADFGREIGKANINFELNNE